MSAMEKVVEFDPNAAPAIDLAAHAKRKKTPPKRTSTNVIMAAVFDPIRWIVPGYVPEGFSVLAGRQKLGKTWLAMDWGLAVATGGIAMGAIPVECGDVLYVDLENGPRRIQRRITALYGAQHVPDLSRLEWQTEAPILDKGLIDQLDDWRRSVRSPRLVVIDVLQRIKPMGNATRNSYENDYAAWAPLQSWATEYGIGVVGLHHTKKGGADDPLEALSGSNGLSATADTTLLLDRNGDGISLYVRGRDVDEKESALVFSAGSWTVTGDAAKERMSSERRAIIDALESATEPLSPSDVADLTSMSSTAVRQSMSRMARGGEIAKAGRGRYRAVVTGTQTLSQPLSQAAEHEE